MQQALPQLRTNGADRAPAAPHSEQEPRGEQHKFSLRGEPERTSRTGAVACNWRDQFHSVLRGETEHTTGSFLIKTAAHTRMSKCLACRPLQTA